MHKELSLVFNLYNKLKWNVTLGDNVCNEYKSCYINKLETLEFLFHLGDKKFLLAVTF